MTYKPSMTAHTREKIHWYSGRGFWVATFLQSILGFVALSQHNATVAFVLLSVFLALIISGGTIILQLSKREHPSRFVDRKNPDVPEIQNESPKFVNTQGLEREPRNARRIVIGWQKSSSKSSQKASYLMRSGYNLGNAKETSPESDWLELQK